MGEPALTQAECEAMRLLADDGWEPGTLKMVFELSAYRHVKRHVEGECVHHA